MLHKLTPLLVALAATSFATSTAWAQSSIEDLDADGGSKAKKKKAAAPAAEAEVIREVERGAYIKTAMGSTMYLGSYANTLRSGTTMGLTFGQDFVDQERRSMAWEVSFTTALHNGDRWDSQPGVAPKYIQGDTRMFMGSAAYEFSVYPTRRLGVGVRVGGGVGYAPLLIHPTLWQEDVLPAFGVDPGVHNSILPFGHGGPTIEYYTKLSHFSVGADVDVTYVVNFDLGLQALGYAKFTF